MYWYISGSFDAVTKARFTLFPLKRQLREGLTRRTIWALQNPILRKTSVALDVGRRWTPDAEWRIDTCCGSSLDGFFFVRILIPTPTCFQTVLDLKNKWKKKQRTGPMRDSSSVPWNPWQNWVFPAHPLDFTTRMRRKWMKRAPPYIATSSSKVVSEATLAKLNTI